MLLAEPVPNRCRFPSHAINTLSSSTNNMYMPHLNLVFSAFSQSCCGIKPTKSGTLDSWCRQGVLLLNTVLSVENAKPHSHKKQG